MSKVMYFLLRKTAREMQCPVFLPDKDFEANLESESGEEHQEELKTQNTTKSALKLFKQHTRASLVSNTVIT
jgi:hypothetical protein